MLSIICGEMDLLRYMSSNVNTTEDQVIKHYVSCEDLHKRARGKIRLMLIL